MNMTKQSFFIKKHLTKGLILTITFFLLLLSFSCKKEETLDNPIALGYKNNEPLIINDSGKTLSLSKYDDVKPYFGTYLMVKDKKWGYIKNTGEAVTKMIYDEVYPEAEGKAVVKMKNKYHIINLNGDILYTFPDSYTSSSYFSGNMLIIEQYGKLGYLKYDEKTKSFNIAIKPTYFSASTFSEGIACVSFEQNQNLVYKYINDEGLDLFNTTFSKAENFSNSLAKVGTKTNNKITYRYVLKPTDLKTTSDVSYLKNQFGAVIDYDYASTFENGIAFVANYKDYEYGSALTNTLYYRDYSMINSRGELIHEYGLNEISKDVPKNFAPSNPFYVQDTLLFLNATRSIPTCSIIKETLYKQEISEGGYTEVLDLTKVEFEIDENDALIKSLIKDDIKTFTMLRSYLTSPQELKRPLWVESKNSYFVGCKIYGDKWGFIRIKTEKITNESNVLDLYKITLKYEIPVIYDNIIY